jgi:hypothetical protein
MNRLKALEAVAEAARIVRRLAGARYPTEAEHKLDKALSALTPAAGGGCVSAAPTGCTSDSECAAAGRCLERALPADPAPAEEVGMGTVIQITSAFDTDPQGIYGAHVVTTALCADGSVWMRRDGVGTPGEWACLPLPGDGA